MTLELFFLIFLVFISSIIGTVSGFGTSTIMVPVMLMAYPLPVALLFSGVTHWFVNVWSMIFFKTGARKWKLILWFIIPGVVASYFGAVLSVTAPEDIMLRVIGIFLLLYALFISFNPSWKLKKRNATVAVGGAITGFASGVSGAGGGPIRCAFFSAFHLPKKLYLFASGITAFAIDSTRIVGYVTSGASLGGILLWGMIFFIPATFLGSWLAKKYFVEHLSQKYFHILIAVLLAVVAAKLLIFS